MTPQPFAWYDRRLQNYPVRYEARMVQTAIGPTHVLVSGDADAEPLVLLHGRGEAAGDSLPFPCRRMRLGKKPFPAGKAKAPGQVRDSGQGCAVSGHSWTKHLH
jgi:hypothetical protein